MCMIVVSGSGGQISVQTLQASNSSDDCRQSRACSVQAAASAASAGFAIILTCCIRACPSLLVHQELCPYN